MTQLSIAVVLTLTLAGRILAQRPGGEIRKRTDAGGHEYFEVFADARRGEHGSPAPMRTVSGHPEWPTAVVVRAESTWTTNKTAMDRFDGKGKRGPDDPLRVVFARGEYFATSGLWGRQSGESKTRYGDIEPPTVLR